MEAVSTTPLPLDSVMLGTGAEGYFAAGVESQPSQKSTFILWLVAGPSTTGDRRRSPNDPATETPPGARTPYFLVRTVSRDCLLRPEVATLQPWTNY